MSDFITAGDGCRIAYRLEGPEAAPVLLLSNSLGTAMEMWAPQIPALARSFRVLRYDSRGHGQSDAPAGAYSMDRLGRDVIEMLDALSVSKVLFCGLSKGGMVGQWLGIRAPERRIAAVHQGGLAALVDAVLDRWFTPAFLATPKEQIAPVRAMLTATDPGGYAGCCAAIRDMDMRPILGLIATPTLVIGGSEDPATPPPHSELLARAIPGARLEMLPAAHLSNVEQAEAFTAAVLDHFAA